jgi:hypothetical protein
MEDNDNPNIPQWAYANYLRTFMYDDAQANVLEKALPLQTDHKSKGIKKVKRNPKHMNYDYMDSTRLVQFFSKTCVFYRVRKHDHKISID